MPDDDPFFSDKFKIGMKISVKLPQTSFNTFDNVTISGIYRRQLLVVSSVSAPLWFDPYGEGVEFLHEWDMSSIGTFISDCSNLLYVTPN